MSTETGQRGKGIYIFPGDPTGAPISVIDPPMGSIILDATGGNPSVKNSPVGDNSAFGRLIDSDDAQTMENKRLVPRVLAISYAASITPAGDSSDVVNVGTLTGNITIANPSGTPADGQKLTLRLAQDGTGSRTITWGNAWAFGTDVTAALIPSAASAKWEMVFQWHAGDAKWRAVGIARGF